MPANHVVAHFLDGQVLKGSTHDFSRVRPYFHLNIPSDPENPLRIFLDDVKAVFFVKDPAGDSRRRDLRGFLAGPDETSRGKKIAVYFPDGELVCGYSYAYTPKHEGFFIYPADWGSNNLRIYVNVSRGTIVEQRQAAEALAQRIIDAQAA